MTELDIIAQIARMEREYDYDEEIVFSKFLKKYGENYSQVEFIKFLRKRYKVINSFHGTDNHRR